MPNKIGDTEKILLWAFAITGLKSQNYPDANQIDILLDFLTTNYPTHSPSEIRHAFNLAISGKLDVDPNHFQSFSASYIARILNAYAPIRAKARKSLQSNENHLKIDFKNMPTPDEKENIRKNYIRDCIIRPWNLYVRTDQITFGITPPRLIFETLTEDLKILSIPPNDKKRIFKQAEQIEIQKLEKKVNSLSDYRRINEIKAEIEKNGTQCIIHDIRSTCYEISIREFFQHCKSSNINLAEIIESKI
ncbi:MAG: hypothetical protein ACKOQP_03020 [Bacteroidota bacterium]